MIVYGLRHQHHGIYTDALFANRPTEEQIRPIKAYLDAVHAGLGEGWLKVVELCVLFDGIPEVPETPQQRRSAPFGVSLAACGEVR